MLQSVFRSEHSIKQRSRLEDACIRCYPVLTAILTYLSGSDAALLLAVVGLYYNEEWAGIRTKFVCLQRDVPEHSQWIDTMVSKGHKAFFVGGDLDDWAARLRYPLTCRRYSTLRVWLAVRVRNGVDAELNERRRSHAWAYFTVTREGDVLWGPSRSTRHLRSAFWTDSNVIPIPHYTRVPEPIIPVVSWCQTDIPNENGIELVWAQTNSAGRPPVIRMCPTQWGDQWDRGQEGWHHHTTIAWREECDRLTPGAVQTTTNYRGQSSFRLPYYDISSLNEDKFEAHVQSEQTRNLLDRELHLRMVQRLEQYLSHSRADDIPLPNEDTTGLQKHKDELGYHCPYEGCPKTPVDRQAPLREHYGTHIPWERRCPICSSFESKTIIEWIRHAKRHTDLEDELDSRYLRDKCDQLLNRILQELLQAQPKPRASRNAQQPSQRTSRKRKLESTTGEEQPSPSTSSMEPLASSNEVIAMGCDISDTFSTKGFRHASLHRDTNTYDDVPDMFNSRVDGETPVREEGILNIQSQHFGTGGTGTGEGLEFLALQQQLSPPAIYGAMNYPYQIQFPNLQFQN
ncbi:hypothetical protein PG985_006713 [Apiospora marii]|uniref:C2H2-type domain-containing protein n=1 Tax=Apiospora marii TaxID=335849 RepID=A0ABR1S8E9_9PEZI